VTVLDVLMIIWTAITIGLTIRAFTGSAPTFVLRASKKSRRTF
jgi:hypothetical protein